MKTKLTLMIMIIASFYISPAFADNEAKRLVKLDYKSFDINADGEVALEEYQERASNVFYSMDGNQDEILIYSEFREWGFGMSNIAEDLDKLQAFDTARKVLFDFWDTSFDWQLTREEKLQGFTEDFKRADKDENSRLSEEEYLRHSIINVVRRAALKHENEWQEQEKNSKH